MSGPIGPTRRILLVAYFYPPMNIIGARRPHALAKWLRRRGHQVTVLTSLYSGRHGGDPSVRVMRSRDLLATRLNWRPWNFEVMTGEQSGSWQPGPGLWGSIFVPDVQVISWIPLALGAALRLHRRLRFDAVVTTSPVESAHGIGLALSRRGVAWVADLRDGWRFESPREEDWPLGVQRRLDGMLERIVVRGADRLVTVSEPLSVDLAQRHGVPAVTITNGFDPDDLRAAEPPPNAVAADKLTFVHTGRLGAKQTLSPLLEALARLAAEDESLRERVELVLAGAMTEQEQALYSQSRFATFVRHVGFVSHSQAIGLQRTADVLLLVTSGERTSEATGKLYEYLAAARPVLVLGAGTAAGAIVERLGAGWAIPARDPDAAENALRTLLAAPLRPLPASARDQYAYPVLAARYEQVIQDAISHRQPRG